MSEASLRLADTNIRLVAVRPALNLCPFVFEVLVLFKEMLDFVHQVVVDVTDIVYFFKSRVFR